MPPERSIAALLPGIRRCCAATPARRAWRETAQTPSCPVRHPVLGRLPARSIKILAVKATQNDAARPWLTRLCDERTVVAVLQNGTNRSSRSSRIVRAVVPVIVWCSAETQPVGVLAR